ncbi:lachesin-like isoform X2 [Atheta coriaria]
MRQWSATTRGGLSKSCTQDNGTTMISIGGRLLLCAFLPAITGQQISEPEPVFLAPLENHTVTQGRDIFFTCVVNHLSSYKVAWIKSDTKAILAIHTHMVAQNQRLSVTHNGHNTWKLHVSNVQKNDSGTYMCQINTDPMRSQMGTLEVVIPPDILNDNESTEGGGVALEGGTVRLKCHAVGVPSPTVLWRREDSKSLVFRNETSREKQVQRSFDGDTLVLTNIQRADMGAYLCIASNGVPPSVSKRFSVRVHFHPLIRVSNQLVAAPVASDVLVQCYVEASPRAMNHWTRDTGEKLIPSDKYAMEETVINEYSLLMNLTIRSLEKKDFGGYVCTSSNALGKAEGVVRLQELHLIVKTTSTTPAPRRVDSKPRKPSHKEKPTKKYTRPTKGRKDGTLLGGDGDDEDESGRTASPESRTAAPPQSPTPSITRTPPWVLHHNQAASSQHPDAFALIMTLLVIGLLLHCP